MDNNTEEDKSLDKDTKKSASEDARRSLLVNWVMTRVDKWRRHRDSNYSKRWSEYYRLWRGFWADEDKGRDSERSKLIAPALQQAIEMTVSEMEEATFGRELWIDVTDDIQDENKEDAELLRDCLLEDFEWAYVPRAVTEAFLNGGIYGTGIAKILTGRSKQYSADESGSTQDRFKVWVEPIHPQNFVIDPGAKTVDEALGCAHEVSVPRHRIVKKQETGVYYKTSLMDWTGEDMMLSETGKLNSTRDIDHSDMVFITEYHGLIPKRLLKSEFKEEDAEEFITKDEDGAPIYEDGELVEAIVAIANKSELLKDVENPFLMKDRAIISYQHETVPNQFWGRGVSEKGYNPQKALDAELRARMDALGLLTYPIMGADATRLPRGLDLRLRPGKMFLTNGRPSEILEPISFGNLDPATFQNSSDLERMVQMGTGAMDSAIPSADQRRNETVGGMGMMQSGFLKRAKRTMNNVEQCFLQPLVRKALWRYMQFYPDRYPKDYELKISGTMGIMAREVEMQMLTQLMQVVPPESPIFPTLLKGIIENSVSPARGELIKAIESMSKPDPKKQAMEEQMQQLQLQNAQLVNKDLQAKVAKSIAEAELARAKAEREGVLADLEDDKVEIMAAQVVVSNKEADVAREQIHHNTVNSERDRQEQGKDREAKAKEAKKPSKTK